MRWARNAADRYRLGKLKTLYRDRGLGDVTADSLALRLPASSPATYNRYANLVTAVLNLARRQGHLEAVPAIPRKGITPGRLRWLTREEWNELRKHLPEHQRAMAAS